jgi:molybdate transport system substrate-binding protein
MKRRLFVALSTLALTTTLTSLACSQSVSVPSSDVIGAATEPAEPTIQLTISVAASVQDAMTDIQVAYEDAYPDIQIVYNFGSSGSLAQQISQGAPADVFLSASQKWLDDLEDNGQLVEGSRHNLLLNSLVLIVPSDRTDIHTFDDFMSDRVSRIAIGEPESVPAGRYAKESLISLNLFDNLQSKLVFAKDVRQVLSYVETGNVDAGLVYATDANVSDRVQVVSMAPSDTHSPIIYPVSVVADSRQVEAAQTFVEFLSSEPAIEIFESYGFLMADQ